MTTPKRSLDTYPASYLEAVERAFTSGTFTVHCRATGPAAVRMQFYGFLKALRSGGKSELADCVAIVTDYEARTVTLTRRELTAAAVDIENALRENSPETPLGKDLLADRADDFLSRFK